PGPGDRDGGHKLGDFHLGHGEASPAASMAPFLAASAAFRAATLASCRSMADTGSWRILVPLPGLAFRSQESKARSQFRQSRSWVSAWARKASASAATLTPLSTALTVWAGVGFQSTGMVVSGERGRLRLEGEAFSASASA